MLVNKDMFQYFIANVTQGLFNAVFGVEFRPQSQWEKGLYYPKKCMCR